MTYRVVFTRGSTLPIHAGSDFCLVFGPHPHFQTVCDHARMSGDLVVNSDMFIQENPWMKHFPYQQRMLANQKRLLETGFFR